LLSFYNAKLPGLKDPHPSLRATFSPRGEGNWLI
jgi:hypothetical protein